MGDWRTKQHYRFHIRRCGICKYVERRIGNFHLNYFCKAPGRQEFEPVGEYCICDEYKDQETKPCDT